MDSKARERAFQDHIIAELASTGWLVGESAHYDQERALYPEDLIAFVQESQPEGWQKEYFAKLMVKNRNVICWMRQYASPVPKAVLWLLRNQIRIAGIV